MTILYNCKHSGDQYRITKFDDDCNPISSYLTTATECDCPAGVRPMCRHREMLPMFIAREAVGNGWWYDYDRGGWVDMRQDETADALNEMVPLPYTEDELPPLPEGVQVLALDEPVLVHNTIAEAIGESEAKIKPYRKPNDGRRV